MKELSYEEAKRLAKNLINLERRWHGRDEGFLIEPVTFHTKDKKFQIAFMGDGAIIYSVKDGYGYRELRVPTVAMTKSKWIVSMPKTMLSRAKSVWDSVTFIAGTIQKKVLDCLD